MKILKFPSRRPTRSLLSCALAACLAAAAPAVLAQSTSATLRGTVTADAAPAANAQVSATNLASGYKSRVETGADGNYFLAGLQPGSYRIDVTAGGKTSSRTVILAVGQTASLDLAVGSTPELGTVTVVGTALAETRTSEVATYVTAKQIEALPQGTRNFLAFADTVPGMQFTSDNDGKTRLRSGAQTASALYPTLRPRASTTGGTEAGRPAPGRPASRGRARGRAALRAFEVMRRP